MVKIFLQVQFSWSSAIERGY